MPVHKRFAWEWNQQASPDGGLSRPLKIVPSLSAATAQEPRGPATGHDRSAVFQSHGRFPLPIVLAVVLLSLLSPFTSSAEQITFEATLIHASNQPAGMDMRLDQFEHKLRQIFGFEFYRYYGRSTTKVNIPNQVVLPMGHGNNLTISAKSAGKGRVEAQVVWENQGQMVLSTTVVMPKAVPIILGGIPQEGGTLIVALTVK